MDVDLVECCLVLSRDSELSSRPQVSADTSGKAGVKQKRGRRSRSGVAVAVEGVGLSPGSPVVGVVEHKTPYYLLLSCPTLTGHRLAYGLMDTVSVT